MLYRTAENVIMLLLANLLTLLHYTQGYGCPAGWSSIRGPAWKDDGSQAVDYTQREIASLCVRPFLTRLTQAEAEKKCSEHGSTLLPISRPMQDIFDLLDGFYEEGVLETSWMVNATSKFQTKILQRDDSAKYSFSEVSPSSALPYICALTQGGLRRELLREQIIPKGAPQIHWTNPPELFFHARPDGDLIALRCDAQGIPQPKLTWYRNEAPINASAPFLGRDVGRAVLISGGTLLLPPSTALEYSSFHCTASSQLGTARSPSIVLKPAFVDSFPPTRLDAFPNLEGGARMECQSPPHQPKSLTYSWLEKDEDEGKEHRILEANVRRFVSIEGTLFFSHVLPEDAKKFACSIRVPATDSGHYGPFFRLVVPHSSTISTTKTPGTFFPKIAATHPKIFPDVPVRQQTVYLECFAYGNPSPLYNWARVDGRALPSRASLLNHGRVLRIENADISDGGRYACTAGNDLGVATQHVTLQIRDRPRIVQPLVDVLTSTGERIDLECPLSRADLSSTMEWFKNGRPLVALLMNSSQRKRIKASHTSLTISGVEASDGGVYACIASNELGSSSSSCVVEVRDLPPSFPALATPSKIFIINGTSVNVPCAYSASPSGTAQWTDSAGNVLSEKGRIRQKDGMFIIDRVIHADAGPYFCTARNRLGKSHHVMQVHVLDRPRVHMLTSGSKSSSGSINVSCEVELACSSSDECPEALFHWTLNDQPLELSPLRRLVTKSMREEFWRGKRMRQKAAIGMENTGSRSRIGRFACSSFYGVAETELGDAELPPSPMGVQAKEEKQGDGNKGIRVTWELPPVHRDTRQNEKRVDGFLIEMRTRGDRRWRSVPAKNVGSIGERTAFLQSLSPNTLYQFRVRAVSSSLRGDASVASEWIETAPSPPVNEKSPAPFDALLKYSNFALLQVEGLRWTVHDPQTLVVEWNPVETEEVSSGANLRYRVSWGDAEAAPLQTIETRSTSAVVHVNSSSSSCSSIVLSVLPVNNQGPGSTAASTVAFVNAQGELRDLVLDKATAMNGSHVEVSWRWHDEQFCRTLYAVEISCNSTNGHHGVRLYAPAEPAVYQIGKLSPSQEYICSLRPVDQRGNAGKTSNFAFVRTERAPPEEAPEVKTFGWKQEQDGSLATYLEWTAVPFERTAGGNRSTWGYKVIVSISDSATVFDMPEHRLPNPARPSARLEGLQPVYTYFAQVAAYNAGGVGPASEPKSIRLGLRHFQLSSTNPRGKTLLLYIILLIKWMYFR